MVMVIILVVMVVIGDCGDADNADGGCNAIAMVQWCPMVRRGGPGDAARVQMRMKCESVDHGVDGCGAGNGKLGTLLECRSGWWW